MYGGSVRICLLVADLPASHVPQILRPMARTASVQPSARPTRLPTIAKKHCALRMYARRACGTHARKRSFSRALCLHTPRSTASQAAASPPAWGSPCGALKWAGRPWGHADGADPARQERALGMLAARLGRAAPAGAAAGAAELVFPWLLAAAAAAERRTRAAALAALRAVQVRMRGGACRARGRC